MAIFSVNRRGVPFVFFDSAESAVLLLLRCAIFNSFNSIYAEPAKQTELMETESCVPRATEQNPVKQTLEN